MGSRKSAGHLAALFTIIIWGTTFISTKVLLTDFRPVEILFFRFVMGFVALLLICPRPMKGVSRRQEGTFVLAGLCGICLYYLLENIALTDYHLSGFLTGTGYTLWKCGIVGGLCLTASESSLKRTKKVRNGLVLRKGTGRENVEYIMTENDTVIGIKSRGFCFCRTKICRRNINKRDLAEFILTAAIDRRRNLPKNRRTNPLKKEEKSSKNRRIGNGFTE